MCDSYSQTNKAYSLNLLEVIKTSLIIYTSSINFIIMTILIILAPFILMSYFLSLSSIIDLDPYIFSSNNIFSTPELNYIAFSKRVIAIIIGIFITGYFIIAAVYAVKSYFLGEKANLRGFIIALYRNILSFFGLAVMLSILFIPGIFLYYTTSIILFLLLGFSFPSLVAYESGIIDSLKLSYKISVSNIAVTAGYWLFAAGLSFLLNFYAYLNNDFRNIYLNLILIGITFILQFLPLILIFTVFIKMAERKRFKV